MFAGESPKRPGYRCESLLSSSEGFIISGTGSGISKSLSYTPLTSTDGPDGYYVNVKSIKINGRRLALHDGGQGQGQPIRASSMNMTMVAPVGPFSVCFSSQESVPEIELVLQSELVKWKVQWRNSMVQVSDSVMCLGFVDGGLDMSGSVVLGGYQLEDRILEFNLGTGMMGFSPSMLIQGNNCSNMKKGFGMSPTVSV
ncbi:hypothetical protein L2E82_35901 [Cichorium intybus]|uniref:Uncharacterized protein n=1 Tax=Cichorium intybus TaxID=13427 RepID=A0ACB9BQE9_CICIN|nr:hypothetical protein L2E82_35901 [Cichorium intybus]